MHFLQLGLQMVHSWRRDYGQYIPVSTPVNLLNHLYLLLETVPLIVHGPPCLKEPLNIKDREKMQTLSRWPIFDTQVILITSLCCILSNTKWWFSCSCGGKPQSYPLRAQTLWHHNLFKSYLLLSSFTIKIEQGHTKRHPSESPGCQHILFL